MSANATTVQKPMTNGQATVTASVDAVNVQLRSGEGQNPSTLELRGLSLEDGEQLKAGRKYKVTVEAL